jgi:hydroxymethylpyrimidine pyrophosphatase-like HAD family hydrolase
MRLSSQTEIVTEVFEHQLRPGTSGDRAYQSVASRNQSRPDVPVKPRLLVCDVDGTLLDQNGLLRPRVLGAVAAVRESGVAVVLATGRSVWSVSSVARELGLHGPQLMMNGGVFASPVTGELVWARRMEPALVQDAISFARSLSVSPLVCFLYRNVCEVGEDGSVPADVPDFAIGPRLHRAGSVDEIAGYGPIRLYLPTGPQRHQAILAAATAWFGARASIVWSDDLGLEILAPATNKGEAVRILAESMGLRPEEVAAVGDGPNDLEMLAWAGRSAAMDPAPAPVRAAAEIVVPSSAEEGVVEAIRLFFPSLDLGDGPSNPRAARWPGSTRDEDEAPESDSDEPAA